MKVNIREFRANLSKMLEENIVEITRNGKLIGVYTKTRSFSELPEKTQHKIIKDAARQATEDQRELIKSVHNDEQYPIEQPVGQDIKAESVHNNENVYTKPSKSVHTSPKMKKSVHNPKPKAKKFVGFGNYGCGCPKGTTVVCPQHNRM